MPEGGCPADDRVDARQTIRPTFGVTQTNHDHYRDVFSLLEPEPTRGLEPRTYRLQGGCSAS